jgi:hypothetical protein
MSREVTSVGFNCELTRTSLKLNAPVNASPNGASLTYIFPDATPLAPFYAPSDPYPSKLLTGTRKATVQSNRSLNLSPDPNFTFRFKDSTQCYRTSQGGGAAPVPTDVAEKIALINR